MRSQLRERTTGIVLGRSAERAKQGSDMRRRHLARAPLLSACLIVAALAAGCTSSSNPSTPTATSGRATSVAHTASASNTSSAAPSSTAGTSSGTSSHASPTPTPKGTVPSAVTVTKAAVPLSATANFGGQVTARITGIRAVQGKPRLPGEVAGPAIAVTVSLSNGTRKRIAIDSVVNAYYGPDLTPALVISGPPTSPFGSSLAPGKSALGVSTFTVGVADRKDITIEFSYTASAPVVRFRGSAP